MERYRIFTARSTKEIKHKDILEYLKDNDLVEHLIYFDVVIGDMLIYLYDNEAKQIVSYASLDLTKQPRSNLYIGKIETFDSSITGVDNRNKGLASKLLNYITQFARDNDYECIQLSAVNKRAERLYFEHGFVTYGKHNLGWARMEKEVNPRVWRLSCLLYEATKEAYNNLTSVKEEVNKIVKYKLYDNLFEYNIIEENSYNEKYNPYTVFKNLNKNIKLDLKEYSGLLEELYPKLDQLIVHGKGDLKFNVYKMGMMIPISHPIGTNQEFVAKDRICRNIFNLFVDDSFNKKEEKDDENNLKEEDCVSKEGNSNKKSIIVPLPKEKSVVLNRVNLNEYFKGK